MSDPVAVIDLYMNTEHVPGDARESSSSSDASPDNSTSPSSASGDRSSSDSGGGDPGFGFGAGIEVAGGGAKKGAKKKRTRKKAAKAPRRKKASAKASAEEGEPSSDGRAISEDAASEGARTAGTEGSDGESAPRKKKARRRTRKKSTAARDAEEAPEAEAPESREGKDADASEEDGIKKKRRRGRRGGRRRRKKPEDGPAVETLPGEDDDLPDLPDQAELVEAGDGEGAGEAKPKRKRKRSRRRKSDTESDTVEESDGRGRSEESGKKKTKKKARRKKKAKSEESKKTPEELEAEAEALRTQVILVNAIDREEKRVSVVDDSKIVDFLMTSESQKTLVNDIYRGKVVNLEPAIGAAFIDFGQGRNGFLHTSDVLAMYGEDDFTLEKLLTNKVDPEDWDETSQPNVGAEVADEDAEGGDDAPAEKPKGKKKAGGRGGRRNRRRERERRPISDVLKVGDLVAVQVTKDAIGDKGPTLTTYISIPGRYLVLMPSMSRTGVSRKISDDKERRRLKKILSGLKGTTDMGVIVRTAGIGKTKTDLQRDLDYLLGVWENLSKRLRRGRGPAPLYQESDVAVRTLRDLFSTKTKEVVVDDPMVHEQLLEFAGKLMPDQLDRIVLHEADRPVFHHHGIEQDFEKIFARRVDLPSGGSIVFDQAEALVAIDVNSGRTRTDSFDFEEIALKTNLEAVPEIARQIRLRDLGGILVCDFIDMQRSSSNKTVERALRQALADDRARSKLGRISQFGLLEMTRQRLGPGTHKKVFQSCPRCRGTARIRTVQSRAAAILRRLGSALTQKGFTSVELRAHPEVVDYLKEDLYDYVRALEHRFEKEIRLIAVSEAQQVEDSVLRYMRADGREVRPGGRRKR